jgi:hypothetical protein
VAVPIKRYGCQYGRGGQAMIEFILVASAMVLLCSVIGVFLYTFRENSGRVLDHVASEYP